MRDRQHSLGFLMSEFPFGMYALKCLYLYCVAIPAAVAIQHFWNEDEFCQNLNAKYVDKSSVAIIVSTYKL